MIGFDKKEQGYSFKSISYILCASIFLVSILLGYGHWRLYSATEMAEKFCEQAKSLKTYDAIQKAIQQEEIINKKYLSDTYFKTKPLFEKNKSSFSIGYRIFFPNERIICGMTFNEQGLLLKANIYLID